MQSSPIPSLPTVPSTAIQGIPLANVTMDDALVTIGTAAQSPDLHHFCFLNADCANLAYKDKDYEFVLRECDGVFADGSGLKLAGQLLNRPISDNVNGTDMFPLLCEKLQEENRSLYLLGARPGIAASVADWVQTSYPGVRIAGEQHGYFAEDQTDTIIDQINQSQADLLLVAFGAPKQDVWIADNAHRLNVHVAIGVGGLFDFFSGRMPRAPHWVRQLGMEWMFRMLQEPGRLWKRYLIGNFVFVYHVFREKMGWDQYPELKR
ncbi:MAG: WecB/TagA/CpsF family glycosyltransferase [Planctomycetota bacterium]